MEYKTDTCRNNTTASYVLYKFRIVRFILKVKYKQLSLEIQLLSHFKSSNDFIRSSKMPSTLNTAVNEHVSCPLQFHTTLATPAPPHSIRRSQHSEWHFCCDNCDKRTAPFIVHNPPVEPSGHRHQHRQVHAKGLLPDANGFVCKR